MIILNIDLGKELENKFYDRIRDKNLSYLEYVEELIKDDLESNIYKKEQEQIIESSKDGESNPTFNY